MNYDGIANQPGRFKVGKKTILGDEMLGQRVFGEIARRYRQMLNHTPISKAQKEAGLTAMEMYTEAPGISGEYFADLPPCLEGGFFHVPKKDRGTKASPRTIKAVYICRSEEQPGYHRVVPYEDGGLVITLLRTILTNQWVRHEGTYPWRRQPGTGPNAAENKQGPEELAEEIAEYRAEEPEPDYEVREILAKGMNDNKVMVYEVKWKGYGDEHNSWLSLDGLVDATVKAGESEAGCAAGVTECT